MRDNQLIPLEITGVWEYLYERRDSDKTVGEMVRQVLFIINKHYTGFTEVIMGLKDTINVGADTIAILAQVPPIIEKDNLLENLPTVDEIWDYEKNHPLRTEHFKKYSNFKVWFTCEQKHTSLVQIGSKMQGHGCKACKGQEATEEYNFELLFPEIAREWNAELNKSTPDNYLPFSNEEVYWDCPKCKTTYDNAINDRTGGKEGCPYCAGRRVNETNCISTTHPILAKEWRYNTK